MYRVRCAQGFMSMAQSVHRARMGRSGVLAVIFSMSVIFFSNLVEYDCHMLYLIFLLPVTLSLLGIIV